MSYSRDERRALCALLDEKGPKAPTLCEGWATLDLAAHLVLRERRPDAGAGIMGGPLARYTEHVQHRLAERVPYPRLVEMVRSGPPRFSVFGLPGMDERGNMIEYFVHHEDVRRGEPGWQPRDLSPALAELIWRRLGMTRFVLRRAPAGIELARDDVNGDDPGATRQHRMSVKTGTPVVTVVGHPAELLMWALGRTTAAQVRLDGADKAIEALNQAHWRL
jgi:uncharacterized protein (TIGR03085 family)